MILAIIRVKCNNSLTWAWNVQGHFGIVTPVLTIIPVTSQHEVLIFIQNNNSANISNNNDNIDINDDHARTLCRFATPQRQQWRLWDMSKSGPHRPGKIVWMWEPGQSCWRRFAQKIHKASPIQRQMTPEAHEMAYNCRGTLYEPSSRQNHLPHQHRGDAHFSVRPSASPQCPGEVLVVHIDLQAHLHGVPKVVDEEQVDRVHVVAWPYWLLDQPGRSTWLPNCRHLHPDDSIPHDWECVEHVVALHIDEAAPAVPSSHLRNDHLECPWHHVRGERVLPSQRCCPSKWSFLSG